MRPSRLGWALLLPLGLVGCEDGVNRTKFCEILDSPDDTFRAYTEFHEDFWYPTGTTSVCIMGGECETVVRTVGSGSMVFFWRNDTTLVMDTDGKDLLGSRKESVLRAKGFQIVYEDIRGVAPHGLRAWNPELCYGPGEGPI